jgi:SAM-dependent methyltransferase
MKLSIFTPSHNTKFLPDCWESIKSQADGLDVEWVILLNGKARNFGVSFATDPRVKVVIAPAGLGGIGALKSLAVEHCTGDVLIELDHDDVLLPGCLEAIAQAMSGGGETFFASGTFETKKDGAPNLYDVGWGWEHADSPYGRYNVPFDPTPRSLCEIFFTPNHVRAWSREAYEKAGGYDATLAICDDQDLLCRTYLAGVDFVIDQRPLYHQRATGENTQVSRNADIQKKQAELRDKYLHALIKEWCRREDLALLDFGGAFGCPEGFTPVDIRPVEGGIQCDLSCGKLPFETGSVGFIRAVDFLEHIPIGRVVPLMNEIHRILAPGGFFYSLTPSTDGRGAFQDPTHCSFWNSNSFWYYCEEAQAKYVPEITAKFQRVGMLNTFPTDWHKQHNIVYVEATLAALKGQRQAGAIGFPR